jgi:2-methylcitrate dehydratase PrpD
VSEHATRALIESVAGITAETLPAAARVVARHCVLDWFGVAIAGSREPLSEMLVAELAGGGAATLAGRCERAAMLDAALINGAMSHALDFDDTHTTMSGHPSVPVMPAVLALAERDDRSGAAFIAALIAGIEVECRLGALMNPGHYALGFHATGTLGTFGAAAASAHLLGLDEGQWGHALGLAGTQAAGLKSGFGTMAKPLHAGRAAANGLLSAQLAKRGFTGNPEVIETQQGFAVTHGAPEFDAARIEELRGRFLITETLFKYHASCYLTHAAIDASLRLRAESGLRADEIDAVEINGSAACIGVCDIAEPATGLEGKFSLRATTAMALLGDDTSDPASFTDARMGATALLAMRDRVTFLPERGLPSTRASVTVHAGGRALTAESDSGVPASDLDAQWERLTAKFYALASPVVGRARAERLHAAIAGIEEAPSVREIAALSRPGDDR